MSHNIQSIKRTLPHTTLSFKHFQLRSEVLKLYRYICRVTQQRCTIQQRNEIREFAVNEFRSSRHITDIEQIKTLIRNGKNQVEHLETTLNLAY